MADYKELLRRAVEALPENNGAARRAVYEKARAALVGQLRAINPPLAARDITAHRLQLEDCIRQVEQEASEAVIAGLGAREESVPPPPVYFEPPPKSDGDAPVPAVARPMARQSMPVKEARKPLPSGNSIEEIIAAANTEQSEKPEAAESKARSIARPEAKPMGKPVPKLVPTSKPKPAPAAEAEDEPGNEPLFADHVEEVDAAPEKPALDKVAAEKSAAAKSAPAKPVVDEEPEEKPAAPRTSGRPLPSIVARAEAVKSRSGQSGFGTTFEGSRRGSMLEPRRDIGPRVQPAARGGHFAGRSATAPAALFADEPVTSAMSAVREVELEVEDAPLDPQGAIDRAIATLDREAKADAESERPEARTFNPVNDDEAIEDEAPEADDADDVQESSADDDLFASRDDGIMPESPLFGGDGKRSRFKKAKPAREAKEPKPKREKPAKAAKPVKLPKRSKRAEADLDEEDDAPAFPPQRARRERGGMGAVTIFLIVFAVLLVGAGGAGFWAWREGYVDLDAMFGARQAPAIEQSAAVVPAPAPSASAETPATGPGNTDTPAATTVVAPELKQADRLTAELAPVEETPEPLTEPLALVDPGKSEERLGTSATPNASAEQAVASLDPATATGSQSLLLERADTGVTVPFSGTVDWSKGTDERGLPTVVGKASIPARNLGVDILIRKNSDPSLPASHLMEVNFRVSDAFIGGSIAGLPGVLLKNEELVQGTPLVGASARVVGNSFLFALSAAPEDISTNTQLLTGRKWMDLALIYATGKRAIITLEKDDAAVAMFDEVVDAWSAQASAE